MRIAVTGASGNIGTALLRRLAADVDHEVVGVVRRPPTGGWPYERVRWFATDLTAAGAPAVLSEAFTDADAVVHLAWGFQPSHHPDYLQRLGVGGTARVIEAAEAAGVAHLVHMSSVGAYSHKESDVPVDESWPTEGVPSSPYSRHKVAAERLLDGHAQNGSSTMTITRLRPGIVGQRAAGSALLRYGVPALVPSAALGWLPVLPLDRSLLVPMVHADDVADAVVRVLDRRAAGAFNLAADEPVTAAMMAAALGARHVHVPASLVRAAASGAWHAQMQQVDPGWVDLGFSVPLLDTSRARGSLGWRPEHTAQQVLDEVVGGMRDAASTASPALRPRSVREQAGRLLRHGPVSRRRLP